MDGYTTYKHQISRRSSLQVQGAASIPVNTRRKSLHTSKSGNNNKKTNGQVKTTLTRLEYLNKKFNIDPSFDIEVSGDEDEDEKETQEDKHENQDIDSTEPTFCNTEKKFKYDTQLMNIDVKSKAFDVTEMATRLDASISLLTPLFQYIQDFEINLKTVSNEMEVLQTRLISLNSEIQQNSKLDNLFTPVLNDILISPECVDCLVNKEIDDKWVIQLTILQEKKEILQNYQTKDLINQQNIDELVELIEKLELKCTDRIKRFLIENIKSLRSISKSSVKIQGKLLKVKEIISFLKTKNNKLEEELRIAYIYTMRWYYYFNLVKYISSLESLKILEHEYDAENSVNSSSVIRGSAAGVSRSLVLDNSNSINEYLINLPRRLEHLNDKDNKYSILAQIAESNGVNGNNTMKFYIEQIFQFLNQTMMDNLTIEFNFIVEFFGLINNEDMNSMIDRIFKPVCKLGDNFTKYLLQSCKSDYFGILLTIRKVQRMEYEIQKRCLPEMFNTYLNMQLMKLWPVFQRNIDVLCNSITFTFNSTSVIKQVINSKNILVPLKLTQSFSVILSNLVKLVQNLVFELETCEPLNNSIQRLSNTFERGIVQLGNSIGPDGGSNGESRRHLFLYVNFQLVYTVVENDVEGGNDESTVGATMCRHYKELVDVYS